LIDQKSVTDVPILSWVSAGAMARDDVQQDVIGEIRMYDLDPRGEWIALRVEGDSMDRISPPGSLILVDLTDKALVPNACYIITDSDSQATYKRFRSNPSRFEPVSTNPSHDPIYPDGEPAVIGRVRRSLIDM
jgi:SOS-response transcriptional repressor LexA